MALGERAEFAHDGEIVAPADVGPERRGPGEEADAGLTEGLQRGRVFELARDFGGDALLVKPLVERASQRRRGDRQQERRARERPGEARPIPRRERPRAEDDHGRLAEQVAEGVKLGAGVQRRVGEHQVEPVQGELGEQAVRGPLAANETHPFR
jgi:hypothetical protein